MSRIMIFGGTTEGRELCERLIDKDVVLEVYVATDKGAELLPKADNLKIHIGRLDGKDIRAEYKRLEPDMVVDATHPYAEEISENIRLAADRDKYIRLLREESDRVDALYAEDMDKAIDIVNRSKGNILMTTGSKEMESYTRVSDYKKRLYVRMLPENANLRKALSCGIHLDHIIDGEGPFTEEENIEAIEQYDIKYLVTKESGAPGGFMEKYTACKKTNTIMVVVERPKEKGYSIDKVIELIDNIDSIKQVYIIGIGMGNPQNMTAEAIEAIESSEVVIGAKRIADAAAPKGKEVIYEYRAEEIKEFIENRFYRKIAVVFSGDVCLYSGAKELTDILDNCDVRVIQGISSVSYLASKMGISWADSRVVSMHGRECDIVREVSENRSVFVLTGGNTKEICMELTDNGLGNVKLCIGERLSYYDEKITAGYAKDLVNGSFDALSTMYIENDSCGTALEIGIDDDEFIRGNVPMTKSEVRACVISALKLRSGYTVYDIGAGTGSVTVEAAGFVHKVYAIECNTEGCELIRQNCIKFGRGNVEIINGYAEDVIDSLPKPDCVFIGGTKGKLNEILDKIAKKGDTHIVMTAVSVETVYKALEYFRENNAAETELKQINAARGKGVGGLTMLMSENPVFILSGRIRKK